MIDFVRMLNNSKPVSWHHESPDTVCVYYNGPAFHEETLRRVEELEDEIYWMDHEGGKMRRKEFDRQDGWTKHLSFVDHPGEFYWYNLETGECVWDGWDGDVNEPNWWC